MVQAESWKPAQLLENTFSEWVKVFGDEKLTTALLERLSHHAHILTTRGDSFRSQRAIKAAATGGGKKEAHPDNEGALITLARKVRAARDPKRAPRKRPDHYNLRKRPRKENETRVAQFYGGKADQF